MLPTWSTTSFHNGSPIIFCIRRVIPSMSKIVGHGLTVVFSTTVVYDRYERFAAPILDPVHVQADLQLIDMYDDRGGTRGLLNAVCYRPQLLQHGKWTCVETLPFCGPALSTSWVIVPDDIADFKKCISYTHIIIALLPLCYSL